jgi:hypothetical protein
MALAFTLRALTAQHCASGRDLFIGARGQIGERALAHATALAERLSQQIRGACGAVRDDIDVLGYLTLIFPEASTTLHGYMRHA